jgi:hypothetical protein
VRLPTPSVHRICLLHRDGSARVKAALGSRPGVAGARRERQLHPKIRPIVLHRSELLLCAKQKLQTVTPRWGCIQFINRSMLSPRYGMRGKTTRS